jgi:hypothetical protein
MPITVTERAHCARTHAMYSDMLLIRLIEGAFPLWSGAGGAFWQPRPGSIGRNILASQCSCLAMFSLGRAVYFHGQYRPTVPTLTRHCCRKNQKGPPQIMGDRHLPGSSSTLSFTLFTLGLCCSQGHLDIICLKLSLTLCNWNDKRRTVAGLLRALFVVASVIAIVHVCTYSSHSTRQNTGHSKCLTASVSYNPSGRMHEHIIISCKH